MNPRVLCAVCGRVLVATTALASTCDGRKYFEVRRHKSPDGVPCPGRSSVPEVLALAG